MKLIPEDVDITIVRTFKLDEPTVVDRGRSRDQVLATHFRMTKQTWIWGEHDVEYAVHGQVLKADGTPDKRKDKGWFDLPGPPTLPDLPELRGQEHRSARSPQAVPRRARRPGRRAGGMTICDVCGDTSNSAPLLPCGRVEYNEEGEPVTQPCAGIYRLREEP